MKRSRLTLADVAEWGNLAEAAHRAAAGKRHRQEVEAFLGNIERNLASLQGEILAGNMPLGNFRRFRIHDPKPRTIHAPCFRERVLHHALMKYAGPFLERSLVDDTFACRVGKGTLAAVARCQSHVRRFPWYCKVDVRNYFASICHATLSRQLHHKFRCRDLLRLIDRIVHAHHDSPGRGLPIGALTSQVFANCYLAPLDRFLLEQCAASGMVRYMDDIVFWAQSKPQVLQILSRVREFAAGQLGLTIKPTFQVNRSARGVTVCGYRVHPGTILLAASRKRKYRDALARWESQWLAGRIDSYQLQRGYDAACAITLHADSLAWRRRFHDLPASWRDRV